MLLWWYKGQTDDGGGRPIRSLLSDYYNEQIGGGGGPQVLRPSIQQGRARSCAVIRGGPAAPSLTLDWEQSRGAGQCRSDRDVIPSGDGSRSGSQGSPPSIKSLYFITLTGL